jgi:hypothetical protein
VDSQKPRPATFIFAAIVLGGLVLANVVGRFQVRAEPNIAADENRPGLSVVRTTDAGWPWTYLVIRNHRSLPLLYLDEGIAERSLLAIAANAGVMLAIVLGSSWVFHSWSLRRRKLLQFGLLDVALLTTAAALVLGMIFVPRWQHARDAAVVEAIEVQSAQARTPVWLVVWQPDRHEWLRLLIGAKRLPPGSHVVGIDLAGARSRDAARLPRLQVLKLRGRVAEADLRLLDSLPELECLDLSRATIAHANPADAEPSKSPLLPLPKLQRLIAPASNLRGSDLSACTGLQDLDLSRTPVDPSSAAAIGRLPSLRVLNLSRTGIDDAGVRELTGLQHLTVLDLSGTHVTDAGLAHLSRLPALKTLWLTDTAVTDAGMVALQDCPKLSAVWVVGSQVTPRGVSRLRAARKERLAKQ